MSEINNLIDDHGLPTDEKSQTQESCKYDKYIEAQVWDSEIINDIKTKPTID